MAVWNNHDRLINRVRGLEFSGFGDADHADFLDLQYSKRMCLSKASSGLPREREQGGQLDGYQDPHHSMSCDLSYLDLERHENIAKLRGPARGLVEFLSWRIFSSDKQSVTQRGLQPHTNLPLGQTTSPTILF
jgi:hypothetical protein